MDYRIPCSHGVWDSAHVHLQHAVEWQKIQADRHRRPHPRFQVGQRVWLSMQNLRLRLPCRKLSPRFVGTFHIVCQVNPVSYRLQLPLTYHIPPTFNVSLLKPACHRGDNTSLSNELPPPLQIEGTLAYKINSQHQHLLARGSSCPSFDSTKEEHFQGFIAFKQHFSNR